MVAVEIPTLCLLRRSFESDALISLRRTLDGAVKCALRLLRRDEERSKIGLNEMPILQHGEASQTGVDFGHRR